MDYEKMYNQLMSRMINPPISIVKVDATGLLDELSKYISGNRPTKKELRKIINKYRG